MPLKLRFVIGIDIIYIAFALTGMPTAVKSIVPLQTCFIADENFGSTTRLSLPDNVDWVSLSQTLQHCRVTFDANDFNVLQVRSDKLWCDLKTNKPKIMNVLVDKTTV